MSKPRGLDRYERTKILVLAERYVKAPKGSVDAFDYFVLVRYLKELRTERIKHVEKDAPETSGS